MKQSGDPEGAPTTHTLHEWRSLGVGTFMESEKFSLVSINEAIAGSDRFANWARSTIQEGDDHIEAIVTKHRNLSSVLCWFRDKLNLENMGQVLEAIEQRKVPRDIILLWAEMMPDKLPAGQISSAIGRAYPEIGKQIDEQLRVSTERTLENLQRIIEEL